MAHIHRGGAGRGQRRRSWCTFSNARTNLGDWLRRDGPRTGDRDHDDARQLLRQRPHDREFPDGAIRGQLSEGPPPAGEAHLLPVPLRAYDSRDNAGAKFAANETRTISLATAMDAAGASFIAVPPGATAAIVTLTVTETVGPGGFLKLYSAALATQPATSSINWAGTNQNLAVTTQVAVDATGSVKVTGGANSTHFVIDVIGYLF